MTLKAIKSIIFIALILISAAAPPLWGAEQPKGREIPWDKIAGDKIPLVREVLASHTLYRQVEDTFPLCSPATFDYMMDRLRITNVVMREVSPQMEPWLVKVEGEGRYFIEDQVRTSGTVELLYKTPDFRLYLAKGRWRYWGDHYFGGTIVISLSYHRAPQAPQDSLKTKIRAYIKLESSVISALTKTVDVIIPFLVDRRVALMNFSVRAAGEKICREPQDVYELLLKAPEINEAERKEYQNIFLVSEVPPP